MNISSAWLVVSLSTVLACLLQGMDLSSHVLVMGLIDVFLGGLLWCSIKLKNRFYPTYLSDDSSRSTYKTTLTSLFLPKLVLLISVSDYSFVEVLIWLLVFISFTSLRLFILMPLHRVSSSIRLVDLVIVGFVDVLMVLVVSVLVYLFHGVGMYTTYLLFSDPVVILAHSMQVLLYFYSNKNYTFVSICVELVSLLSVFLMLFVNYSFYSIFILFPVVKGHVSKIMSLLIPEINLPNATELQLQRNNDDCCAICREEFGKEAKVLPCNHMFHSECISRWISKKPICPICRQPIFTTSQLTTFLKLISEYVPLPSVNWTNLTEDADEDLDIPPPPPFPPAGRNFAIEMRNLTEMFPRIPRNTLYRTLLTSPNIHVAVQILLNRSEPLYPPPDFRLRRGNNREIE